MPGSPEVSERKYVPRSSPSTSPNASRKAPSSSTDEGWRINTGNAQTFKYSSEGCFMYPIAQKVNPPLRRLGVTPNQITLFNVLVGLGNGYALVTRRWVGAFALSFLHQLLDAMDGSMARTYSLHSEFGAKLDEYTDIFYGVVSTVCSLWTCWPDALRSALILGVAFALLAGDLAWSSGGKRKTFVEELTRLEFLGLWGLECNSYNMWFLLAVIAGVDKARSDGAIGPPYRADAYASFGGIVAVFSLLCAAMLVNHGVAITASAREADRAGKRNES